MASTTKRIALQNKSSSNISFDDLARLAPVLQTQVDRDFNPLWGATQISVLQKGDHIPTGVWPVFFIDPSDEPGHAGLGVHLDANGKPFAFVADEGFDTRWTGC
jgi:hypothetical protein